MKKLLKDEYDLYWKTCWMEDRSFPQELEKILEKYLNNSSIVLDVGCGDGGCYADYLIKKVKDYYGVDISEVAIEKFKEIGGSGFVCNVEEQLPFETNFFSVVLWLGNAEHLVYPEKTLMEIKRVLRQNGILIMGVPNSMSLLNRALYLIGIFNPQGSPKTAFKEPWNDPHIRFFSKSTLKVFFGKNTFNVLEIKGVRFEFFSLIPKIGKYLKFENKFAFLLNYILPSVFARTFIVVGRNTK